MESSPVLHFGPFALDRVRLALSCDGRAVPVGGRGAAILAILAGAGGAVVARAELLDAVWPGLTVEERNLTVQVATLRKVMAEISHGTVSIGTVARVGYRLVVNRSGPESRSITALRPTVAVLPFANLTADPEMAFFAQGVTEDIIAALSRFRTFAMFARGASLGFRTSAEAAATLDTVYVVEGSVRRDGRRLRVGARLTDSEGRVIWADSFEDELGGVFEMQDQIVGLVVSNVAPGITRAEIERSRRKHPENLDAYDHFLLGLACYHGTSSPYGRKHAMVHHFDRAVAMDPAFPQALAYAALSRQMQSTLDLTVDPTQDFAAAESLCDRAEAAAGDDALVLSIAAVLRHDQSDDTGRAVAKARRAVALNPHNHDVLDFAATVLMLGGHPDDAKEMFLHCLRLGPGSPSAAGVISSIGFCNLAAGRYADAIDWESRAQALHPNPDFGLATLIAALAMDGRAREARQSLDRFLAARPGATVAGLLNSLPAASRSGFAGVWTEGLHRAGMPPA